MPDGKQSAPFPRPDLALLATTLLVSALAFGDARAAVVALARTGAMPLHARAWCAPADTATTRVALRAALSTATAEAGAALDRAADTLRAHGVTRAELTAGRVTRWLGTDHEWWIAHPEVPSLPVVELRGGEGALAFTRMGRTADGRTRVQVGVWAADATRAESLAREWSAWDRDRAGALADGDDTLGVLWLEPHGAIVRVLAWDLECIGLAPCAEAVPLPVPVPAPPSRSPR
jgi:hypothetical protein